MYVDHNAKIRNIKSNVEELLKEKNILYETVLQQLIFCQCSHFVA